MTTTDPGARPARYEVVTRSPVVVLGFIKDLAEAADLADQLSAEWPDSRFITVLSADEGDDVEALLMTLRPVLGEVIVTATSSPGAADPDSLVEPALATVGEDFVFTVPELHAAIRYALGVLADDRRRGWEGEALLIPGRAATTDEARRLFRSL